MSDAIESHVAETHEQSSMCSWFCTSQQHSDMAGRFVVAVGLSGHHTFFSEWETVGGPSQRRLVKLRVSQRGAANVLGGRVIHFVFLFARARDPLSDPRNTSGPLTDGFLVME